MLGEEDDDVPVRRFTTVHSRYHVIGYIKGEGELVEMHQRRRDAFKHAAASIGPRDYERTEVFDSMARVGEPELWSVQKDGTTCVEKRRGFREGVTTT